ncbi:hypothetical protein SRABI27_00668 [Pedobacter sp. Bi27]|uniref:FEKKY domain-containing protein n=2 Tax=Pedobacter TaxID=84567 RepID=UPI001D2392E7|nr:hypothetical protein [Pedobacter sp. Bi36]CAH0156513.1 hypothetical protein SRABI126_00669 [Pedobacter sp. Bi126]CAH0157068.1 hypothetical protein SRABI27_00668 [Pedobacter sp. Bi27]CAH0201763.1 hypothetical protein SRABI36_02011 [Pedobacter sp. Bi36]
MVRILFLIFMFINIVSCNLEKKKMVDNDKTLIMLVYGLPDFEKQHAETVIAKQYGFRFKTVAGCTVSEALRDSVEIKNRITEDVLAQRYGKEWKFRFYSNVDSLYKKQLRFSSKTKKFDLIW